MIRSVWNFFWPRNDGDELDGNQERCETSLSSSTVGSEFERSPSSGYSTSSTPQSPPAKRVMAEAPASLGYHVSVNKVKQITYHGHSELLVVGKTADLELQIVVPMDMPITPRTGDKLFVKLTAFPCENQIMVADSVKFTRVREGMQVKIIGLHDTISGNHFVLFEKSVCCDFKNMPEGAPTALGTLYSVSAVESSQPKAYLWRAFKVEEPVEMRDDGISLENYLDLGLMPYGSVKTEVITITKTPNIGNGSPMLRQLSLLGCPLTNVGPVTISGPYRQGIPPGHFYPTVHFHPFYHCEQQISYDAPVCVAIKMTAISSGKWAFVLKFHFHGELVKDCLITANVLLPDETESDKIIADPDLRLPAGRLATHLEATERLTAIVKSRKISAIVHCSKPPKELGGWPAVFRKPFDIPEDLMDLLNSNLQRDELLLRYPLLAEPLNSDNYSTKLHLLLHLEEYQEHLNVRSFDMLSEELCHVGEEIGHYRLRLSGLQEGRPSIMTGDLVNVRGPADPEGPVFEGKVSQVELEAIFLKFDARFDDYFKQHRFLDFSFLLNRSSYRRLHNAVDMAKEKLSTRLLFPDMNNRATCIKRMVSNGIKLNIGTGEQLFYFNQALNFQQKTAVEMVVLGKGRPLPHIIFGPPGTGKTVTVVEICLQIHKLDRKSRILVCAPSNSGTDLIGQLIIQSGAIPSSSLRRVLGFQRSTKSVPTELSESVQIGCDKRLPDEHRIVLTTCHAASFFIGIPHPFTHIIVDEAGFTTEPELLLSLSAAGTANDFHVVLAGDTQQLGPVALSSFAKEFGLTKSFLKRLQELPAYSEWENEKSFCPYLIHNLSVSYRAVASLLKISSTFFYNSELTTNVGDDKNLIAPALGLPPLTFWPVKSPEVRESRSPSIANYGQACVVVRLYHSLLTVGVAPADIGIITPYRLQAEHIRKALGSQFLPKIGTVDEFQGQEKDAIIMSTVRSRNKVREDAAIKDVLGFVASPQRTNVALTRSRFVLMIIGDPQALMLDKHWRGILRYCAAKEGCYQTDLYNNRSYPLPVPVSRKDKPG